ncbi:MAG: Rrf2 family transcriptional regulator [bacterium]|nr:Rrf2 family transcriptional regulator [bacterium]
MFLTLETDYAIRIVEYLAQSSKKTDARTIAQKTGVTQRYALKILRKLVLGGIVKSYKGAKGGYLLASEPAEISLLDVVLIFNNGLEFSSCQLCGVCSHPTGMCRFNNVFNRASENIRELFKNTKFNIKEDVE